MTETEFAAAIDSFVVSEIPLVAEPDADDRIRESVGDGGVLLVGESHGVLENPLVLYTLMVRFDITALALEWPTSLGPFVDRFLATGKLSYSEIAASADGRITAGHFAVLRELSLQGRLKQFVMFDPSTPFVNWSDRDRGMARCLLEMLDVGAAVAAAGNLHTQLHPHKHGAPMGMHVFHERPGSIEIRIRYSAGEYFNFGRKRFRSRPTWPWSGTQSDLTWNKSYAELRIPRAHMAAVPSG